MIEIPVFNSEGQQVDTLQLDAQALGGEVRPALLKLAYVRIHANNRQGNAATKNRARTEGSTRKIYKQKHTGNARRGAIRTNIMRGGGRGHGKVPHSWRKDMPDKMRRLANRNAVLAKAVDGEIKLVDHLAFEKPNTKQFAHLLAALKIERSCLLAVPDTRGHEARSAANLPDVSVARIEHLNVFDLLNHRFLLTDKPTLERYLAAAAGPGLPEVSAIPEEAH
jgi:large subunit ribosomal protein L4